MSEEKIIYGVLSLMEALYNSMLHGTDCYLHLFNVSKYKDALQGLLDLYNKEKEKNKELELNLDFRNKELEKLYDTEEKYINDNFISKDKIKEKIEEIQKRMKEETRTDFLIILKILENELQELLQEGE